MKPSIKYAVSVNFISRVPSLSRLSAGRDMQTGIAVLVKNLEATEKFAHPVTGTDRATRLLSSLQN